MLGQPQHVSSRYVVLSGALLVTLSAVADTTGYEYDALGRLKTVTYDDGTVVEHDYDPAGNREAISTETGSSQNNPPIAMNDSVTIPNLYGSTMLHAVANDSDPDQDPLTITSVTQPANAFVAIFGPEHIHIYSMSIGFSTFTYTVSDGNGGSDTAVVSVNVQQGGGPPPI